MNKGGFTKSFNSFEEGIKELMNASFSVQDSVNFQNEVDLNRDFLIGDIISNLALNTLGDANCHLDASKNFLSYTTSGGLQFGWRHRADYANDPFDWVFFIVHPSGERNEGSSLAAALESAGWEFVSPTGLHLLTFATSPHWEGVRV